MTTHGNTKSPEGQWPPSGMIQCPKDDCARLFTSREVLEAHQMTYSNHAFCRECNIQFKTHEELFLHHLISKRHHNCPICNRVFNSESGRDYHIRTDHPEEQGLVCPGCHIKFSSGKSYTAHVVSNPCKTAAVRSLKKHNDRRETLEQLLFNASHGELISSPAELISPVYSDDDNYRDGGSDDGYLGLPPPRYAQRQRDPRTDHLKNDQGSEETHSAESNNSFSPGLTGPFTEPPSSSNLSSSPSNPPVPNIPNTPAPNTPWSPSDLSISPDDLIAWEDDLDDSDWFSSPSTNHLPNLDRTQGSSSCPQALLNIFPDWDSEEHWNSETKRYFCECGFTSSFVRVFEQHVVMENSQDEHRLTRSSCTHCGKTFRSIGALFAHVEVDHAKSNGPKKENKKELLQFQQFAERRLDMDGPSDIGEPEFQTYDRPPAYARKPSERPRSKLGYGLRSSKVPRGTYW